MFHLLHLLVIALLIHQIILIKGFLDYRWILQLANRCVFNFLDFAISCVTNKIELIGDITVIVYVETIHYDALNATSSIRPKHDENDAILVALRVVFLVGWVGLSKTFRKHIVKEKRQLILPGIVPVKEKEISQVENSN